MKVDAAHRALVFGIVDLNPSRVDLGEFTASARTRVGEHLSAQADGLDLRCIDSPAWSLGHDDAVIELIDGLDEHLATIVVLRGSSPALSQRAEAAGAMISHERLATSVGATLPLAPVDVRSPSDSDRDSDVGRAAVAANVALLLSRGCRLVSVDTVHPAVKARDEIVMILNAH